MPDLSLHQKFKDTTKNRLLRKCLNHLIKELQEEHADILTTGAHLCEKLNPNSWPPETLHAENRTTIPGITSNKNRSDRRCGGTREPSADQKKRINLRVLNEEEAKQKFEEELGKTLTGIDFDALSMDETWSVFKAPLIEAIESFWSEEGR